MAHEIIAPWAERVPGAGPMTAGELLALRDDGWRYEFPKRQVARRRREDQ